MKVRYSLFLGIFLCSLLVGCTLGAPSSENAPSPTLVSSPTPTAVIPTPTSLASHGLITLTLWVPDFLDPYSEDSPGGALFLEQIQAFSELNPDVQVEVLVKKGSGPGGLYNLLSTAYTVAPSVLPDLIVLDSRDLQSAAEKELLQPLSAFDAAVARSFPFMKQESQFDAQSYGVPFLTEVDHMVYTPKVSAASPVSWTAVLSGSYSMLFPVAPADSLADDALLAMYLGSAGVVTDEQGNPLLERASLEELYRFFDAMLETGLLDPVRSFGLGDATVCWEAYQQRLGMLSSVPAGVYWAEDSRLGMPSWVPTRDGDPAALAHSWLFAVVAAEPERQDAATRLTLWLTAPERVADVSRAVKLLPASLEAVALWPLSPDEAQFLDTFLMAAEAPLPPKVAQPVARALQSGLDMLLKGEGTTPEEAATHALTVLRK